MSVWICPERRSISRSNPEDPRCRGWRPFPLRRSPSWPLPGAVLLLDLGCPPTRSILWMKTCLPLYPPSGSSETRPSAGALPRDCDVPPRISYPLGRISPCFCASPAHRWAWKWGRGMRCWTAMSIPDLQPLLPQLPHTVFPEFSEAGPLKSVWKINVDNNEENASGSRTTWLAGVLPNRLGGLRSVLGDPTRLCTASLHEPAFEIPALPRLFVWTKQPQTWVPLLWPLARQVVKCWVLYLY